jgi:hypothetical protein
MNAALQTIHQAFGLARRRGCARRAGLAFAHLDLVRYLAALGARFSDTLSLFFVCLAGDGARELDLVTRFVHRDARKLGLLLDLRLDALAGRTGLTAWTRGRWGLLRLGCLRLSLWHWLRLIGLLLRAWILRYGEARRECQCKG